jgi:hypothetical protein
VTKPGKVYLDTLKYFTTGRDYIQLWVICLRLNLPAASRFEEKNKEEIKERVA